MPVQLTGEQYKGLKSMAAEQNVSIAELVRQVVGEFFSTRDQGRAWARIWEVFGSCKESKGKRDVSRRHDKYLTEIYNRG